MSRVGFSTSALNTTDIPSKDMLTGFLCLLRHNGAAVPLLSSHFLPLHRNVAARITVESEVIVVVGGKLHYSHFICEPQIPHNICPVASFSSIWSDHICHKLDRRFLFSQNVAFQTFPRINVYVPLKVVFISGRTCMFKIPKFLLSSGWF